MNFFKLYIGDYQRDTGTLTLAEHGAYMLMLQHLYATERPLPVGRELHRLLRAATKSERAAIDRVATKFWREADGHLVNDRALEEIRRGAHQRAVNQEVGKRGGRPKRTDQKSDSAPSEETASVSVRQPKRAPNNSQAPALQSEPISPGTDDAAPAAPHIGRPSPPAPDEIIFGYGVGMLTSAGIVERQARSFLGGLRKAHGDAALIEKLRECARAKPLQPLEWLAAALPPPAAGAPARAGKHTGFQSLNYREGIAADGSFA